MIRKIWIVLSLIFSRKILLVLMLLFSVWGISHAEENKKVDIFPVKVKLDLLNKVDQYNITSEVESSIFLKKWEKWFKGSLKEFSIKRNENSKYWFFLNDIDVLNNIDQIKILNSKWLIINWKNYWKEVLFLNDSLYEVIPFNEFLERTYFYNNDSKYQNKKNLTAFSIVNRTNYLKRVLESDEFNESELINNSDNKFYEINSLTKWIIVFSKLNNKYGINEISSSSECKNLCYDLDKGEKLDLEIGDLLNEMLNQVFIKKIY